MRLLGTNFKGGAITVVTGEIALAAMSIYAAALMRFLEPLTEIESTNGPLWPRAVLFSALIVICNGSLGLYSSRQRARVVGIFVRLLTSIAATTAIAAAAFYVFPGLQIGRGVLVLASLVALIAGFAFRLAAATLVDEDALKKRVLVYGAGKRALPIMQMRRKSDRRGFVLDGFIRESRNDAVIPKELLVTLEGELSEYCKRRKIDEIVVAMDDRRSGFPLHELLHCRLDGVEITELLTFIERESGKVRIDALHPSWIIFGSGFQRHPWHNFASRLLDIVVSVAICAICWPLIAIAALAIKLEDGPRATIFYGQARVGLNGKEFLLLKLRSMRADAEQDGVARWATLGDQRVTKVGRLLRKIRVDELPQLLNVIHGSMSIVGPRPERRQIVETLAETIPYYSERHSVKPGLTGWAQICYPYGSSENDALQKLQFDLYYVKNKSVIFDLAIILQTVEVILWSKGAR